MNFVFLFVWSEFFFPPQCRLWVLTDRPINSEQVDDDDSGEKLKWVRTKVVIDDHVIVPDIRAESGGDGGGIGGIGGSASSADKVVEDYVSYLSTVPMDASRPLWELHVLNLRTFEAAAVAVFRIHHSLGDGLSLISLLLACTRRTADPTSLPTLPEPRLPLPPPPRPNALLDGILFMWALMVLTWNTAVDLFVLLASSAWLKDTPTPLKGGAGTELRRKRFVHGTLRLDDVKEIKNSMNCVNFFYSLRSQYLLLIDRLAKIRTEIIHAKFFMIREFDLCSIFIKLLSNLHI